MQVPRWNCACLRSPLTRHLGEVPCLRAIERGHVIMLAHRQYFFGLSQTAVYRFSRNIETGAQFLDAVRLRTWER